jgi:hypothetical protein
MSQAPATFPYLPRYPGQGRSGYAPLLPVTLAANGRQASLHGLLDTGAAANVLPHSVGLHLGFDWQLQSLRLSMSGILSSVEARLVIVSVTVPSFAPIDMGFAWLATDAVPLLFGHMTFFAEFDVRFSYSALTFEVSLPNRP